MAHTADTITEDLHTLAAADPEAAYRRAGFTGDLRREGRNLVGLCPLHADTDASFAIGLQGEYLGRWRCFGACQAGGDLLDFYMALHNVEFPTAKDELGRLFGLDGPPETRPRIPPPPPRPAPKPEPEPIPHHVAVRCHEALLADTKRLAWLTERKGLPEWVVRIALLGVGQGPGFDGCLRFTIPIPYHDGREGWANIRGYRPNPPEGVDKFRSWTRGRPSQVCYPWAWVAGETELVWCEGEADALNLIGRGIPALTVTDGAGSAATATLPDLSGRRIRILVDNDDAGEKTRRELPDRLFAAGAARVSVLTWPEGMLRGYDVSDWFASGGDLGGLGL